MSNEAIFKSVMEKAQANGLQMLFSHRKLYQEVIGRQVSIWAYYPFIFWIPFAQAFWGTEIIQTDLITEVVTLKLSGEVDDVQYQKLPAWQWHLQRMVIEENPLDYLAKFL